MEAIKIFLENHSGLIQLLCILSNGLCLYGWFAERRRNNEILENAHCLLDNYDFLAKTLDYMLRNKYVGRKKTLKAMDIVKQSEERFEPISYSIKEEEEAKADERANATETRVCKECGRDLPITEFQEVHAGSGWRRHVCKDCNNRKKRVIYKNNS